MPHCESAGQAPGPAQSPGERFFWPFAAALLACLGTVQVLTARQEAQTFDEAIEMVSGYGYLKTGEFRINTEHPPLGKLLAALPLLALRPELPAGSDDQVELGRRFLYQNRVPADTLLFTARLMTIVATLALGLVLAWWTRRAFGAGAALFALLLFAFDPNVIATGRYVKNDLLVTLLALLCVIAWAVYLERLERRMWIAGGTLFGLAMATKFSAVFLLPVMALLALRRGWHGLKATTVAAGLGMVVVLIVYAPDAGKLVPVTHAFRLQHPDWRPLRVAVDQGNTTGKILAWVGSHLGWRDHAYLVGLSRLATHNKTGHPAYLMGMHSTTGWWYYFPVAFAVKTPVATLAAILLALGLALRSPGRPRFATLALIAPILVYVPICLASRINIGVWHLLPVYPFLFALIGAAFLRRPWRGRGAVLALLGVALAAESLAVYPHYLAFFNVLAGGPANGPRWLVDSNLDWGQDAKKLKTYMDAHDIPRVCTCYFGKADLDYYGIGHTDLLTMPDPQRPDCVVAVSATPLEDVYVQPGTFTWLRQREPTARVGYSIYVYDLRK